MNAFAQRLRRLPKPAATGMRFVVSFRNGFGADRSHPRRVRPQLVPELPEPDHQDEVLRALVLPGSSTSLSTDSAGGASNNQTAGSREPNRTRSKSDQAIRKRKDTK